jgi:hypothetical protein
MQSDVDSESMRSNDGRETLLSDDSSVSTQTDSEETAEATESEREIDSSDEESTETMVAETEGDREIKELMGDAMFVCCQRPERRQEMLENDDGRLVSYICEWAKSILSGEIPINYIERENLIKHKRVLRRLVEPNLSTKDKKQIIVQNGGSMLLSLIPIAVGALASMFQ